MERSWEAVPAHELLEPGAPVWRQYGVAPVPQPEAVAFASLARLLQFGQSLALVLPLPGNDTFLRLLTYLHRLRMDALDGGIRGAWLQPREMMARPDLVVFTRPAARHGALAKVRDLHIAVLRAGVVNAAEKTKRLRTVLVDGHAGDMLALFKAIEQSAQPFLFVIDGSCGGVGEEAAHLDALLQEYFPGIPRTTILTMGDQPALDKFVHARTGSHLWRWRKSDAAQAMRPVAARNTEFALARVQDNVANSHLAAAAVALRTLLGAADKEGATVRQQAVAPLYKVFNALRSVALPLDQFEQALVSATRGGRFPVKSLRRWLDGVRSAEFRYAETGAAITAAADALAAAYATLEGAVSGKAQAVLGRVRKAVADQRAITVLVGNALEAAALERWLEQSIDLEGNSTVSVRPMDGVRAFAKAPASDGEVLLLGVLWPNRLPWLGMSASAVTVPAYPFEVEPCKRALLRWWEQCGRPSLADGDKLHLWQYNWPASGRCLDERVAVAAMPLAETDWPHAGAYRRTTRILELPVVDRYADWIDVLMADHRTVHDHGDETQVERSGPDTVWLRLAGGQPPVAWSRHRPVLLLQGEEIVPRLPDDLEVGDRIVLLHHNEERVATQLALFQTFCEESSGLEEIARFAGKWHALVDDVFKKLGTVAAVRNVLRKADITVTDQTINHWRRHRGLGPENPRVIEAFAQTCGHPSPPKHAKKVFNAIDAIRKEHRRIGRDLSGALIAHAKGVDEVHIGSVKLDTSVFASMVGVCEVEEVVLPAESEAEAAPVDLLELAQQIEQRYPGRLVFTGNAQRSLKNCGFKDVERFGSCLELMASRLWPMYHEGAERMHEILPDFEARQITFAPGMSAVTQGRYQQEYDRTYKGKTVDIGRHFKIGAAWDPSLTMRIHFHWEDRDRQIVIHHAGEHLKTMMS